MGLGDRATAVLKVWGFKHSLVAFTQISQKFEGKLQIHSVVLI